MRNVMLATAATLAMVPATAFAQQAQGARYLDQREVAKAAQEHPQIVAEFGGAETGARGAYVETIGRRVASFSGVANSNQAYRFTTLNSAVENAFAVPGGYVYITRQLMGLMDNESELAFVLGHETGHIAGNHARSRQSRATRNGILGVLGSVLGGVLGSNAIGGLIQQFAQQASQLATLRFSREQEYQADQLGIRYMVSAGYDPQGSSTMLAALGRATALEARVQGREARSTPEWASTHPLSENRVAQARQNARQTGRLGTGATNRDAFLAQLDGLMIDDDPAQGVIDGRSFTHPDLQLQFTVPTGFLMQNGTRAVSIEGSSGKAQFSTGPYDGNPSSYIQQVVYQLTGGKQQVAMSGVQRTNVNGLNTYYSMGRANTGQGVVDVSVFVYEFGPRTAYHFVMLSKGGQGVQPFVPMIQSVRRISTAEAAAIRPRVIDVVTVRPGDTVQSLAARTAYRDYQVERFLSLNGLTGSSRLVPGQKVKLVVFGARR